MESNQRPVIRIRDTDDLLAVVPFLLGFHPGADLILLAVDTSGAIVLAARLDLPATDGPAQPLAAGLNMVITKIKDRFEVSVALVGYGEPEQVAPAVAVARDALGQAGIAVREALRVRRGRFWRLDCDRPEASCPAEGVAFEPSTSPVTAAAIYAGLAVLSGRDALAQMLAPVTGPAAEAMAEASATARLFLVDLAEATAREAAGAGLSDQARRERLTRAITDAADDELRHAQHRYRAGQAVEDTHAARLGVLLALPAVRDAAARSTGRQEWQIQMYSDLVRRADPDFVAAPATLLALCALQAGNGALASIAVDRALEAEPDNRFAQLLAQAVAVGIDPDTVATLLTY
ncbi:DUF4192 domain-containing protein [Rugosimonospora africana]|uniref:DUF4192 domain-containing protein n=1 Tax=Rugosimonospora africana TaxID=556532 RepID=A0A8J3QTT6_9ACTN|nr:DUF4192 domain-containing protein [Rugosimonospora africana]GIH16351.1 hypothetical protein Raf01_45230 [Rugosimonospora africana]